LFSLSAAAYPKALSFVTLYPSELVDRVDFEGFGLHRRGRIGWGEEGRKNTRREERFHEINTKHRE